MTHHRFPSQAPNQASPRYHAEKKPPKQPRFLLNNTEVPDWYTDPYLITEYRPVTHSVRFCFESLAYLHNETVNIYSHLIPAVISVLFATPTAAYFQREFPAATRGDRLILGSFVSGIYIGFYCEPKFQRLYWSMIVQSFATISFVATGLSAFAPIIHAASIFPYAQLDKQAGLRFYYIEGAIVLIGVVFYISRFPEAWRPGKFDIWGASHEIFHVLVVISAIVHLYGILTAFRWNYENPRCPNPSILF
ncbi:HlyIII-domain-containing protein [Podospora australis]|uniref:HlyIII-domain-containing protein n=1 Tax=Podospora australis TaxID=1536484 RepID=A0AAN6WTX4_9PEZI|nr:HlyIII-domain-containing protein [Podospora australis]